MSCGNWDVPHLWRDTISSLFKGPLWHATLDTVRALYYVRTDRAYQPFTAPDYKMSNEMPFVTMNPFTGRAFHDFSIRIIHAWLVLIDWSIDRLSRFDKWPPGVMIQPWPLYTWWTYPRQKRKWNIHSLHKSTRKQKRWKRQTEKSQKRKEIEIKQSIQRPNKRKKQRKL